jgi:hypothetical protein
MGDYVGADWRVGLCVHCRETVRSRDVVYAAKVVPSHRWCAHMFGNLSVIPDVLELIDWDEFEFAVFVDGDVSAIDDLRNDIKALQSGTKYYKGRFARRYFHA